MTEECDLRLELIASTGDSDAENEDVVGNSEVKSNEDLELKEFSSLEEKTLDLSDKVTIDEFVGPSNKSIEPVIVIEDEHEPTILEVPADLSNIDFIEVDTIGHVDMDRAFNSGSENASQVEIPLVFSDDEIQLSSDDEDDRMTDISLVCLKRPPTIETTVECLEILDSDEEFPVCLVESVKNDHVNIEEKRGYIKEYIEVEGSGIIFSHTFGLVLFHLSNVWVNGEKLSCGRTRDILKIGTPVSFYDQSFKGEEYSVLSSDGVLHQAVVAWTGERPSHLMKMVDNMGQEYSEELEKTRKTFMLYLRGEVFLRCALVRVKGMVVGYISDEIGVVECMDENGEKVNVFFSTEDVMIFRKPLKMYEQMYNTPATKLLPVGLHISVDARFVNIPGVRNLSYQAVCVLAGSWPTSPYPTLLPGGQGSYSQAFDISSDQKGTFYYLELALEAKLARKLSKLKDVLAQTRGNLVFIWRNVNQVRGQEDVQMWREQFTNRERPRRNHEKVNRKVQHAFRAPPPRHFKTKEEVDDLSSVATAGGSCAGSVSGVSSKWSRPNSRSSNFSCTSNGSNFSLLGTRKELKRTWYSQENWGHGGLRIKTEVKSEPGQEGFLSKQVKTEI